MKQWERFLVYGNLKLLNEVCFALIFRSIKNIYYLMKKLGYKNLTDVYENTHDVNTLKKKFNERFNHMKLNTTHFDRETLREITNKINDIEYYDINEILIESEFYDEGEFYDMMSMLSLTGGKIRRKSCNKRNNKKKRTNKKGRTNKKRRTNIKSRTNKKYT